jgi:hypothetical protein
VVQVTAVRVVEGLAEPADHLQPGLHGELRAVLGHEVVQPLPAGAVPEDDRRAGLVLLAELLGLHDALVRDALQGQVLAAGGAAGGLAPLGVGVQLRQVDADAARRVAGQRRVLREVVLPGRPGVERLGGQLERPDLAVPAQPSHAHLGEQFGELLGQRGGDDGRAGPVEQVLPDAAEPGPVAQLVTAVHADPLGVVELAPQVGRGQEHRGRDEGDPGLQVQLAGGPLQLLPELLALQVGQVQRVLDRPDAVTVVEQPGAAVVARPARMPLDLDEEEPAGHRDEQVDLADVPGTRRERDVRPGAVRLGGRHPVAQVPERFFFPGERGGIARPPIGHRDLTSLWLEVAEYGAGTRREGDPGSWSGDCELNVTSTAVACVNTINQCRSGGNGMEGRMWSPRNRRAPTSPAGNNSPTTPSPNVASS